MSTLSSWLSTRSVLCLSVAGTRISTPAVPAFCSKCKSHQGEYTSSAPRPLLQRQSHKQIHLCLCQLVSWCHGEVGGLEEKPRTIEGLHLGQLGRRPDAPAIAGRDAEWNEYTRCHKLNKTPMAHSCAFRATLVRRAGLALPRLACSTSNNCMSVLKQFWWSARRVSCSPRPLPSNHFPSQACPLTSPLIRKMAPLMCATERGEMYGAAVISILATRCSRFWITACTVQA